MRYVLLRPCSVRVMYHLPSMRKVDAQRRNMLTKEKKKKEEEWPVGQS